MGGARRVSLVIAGAAVIAGLAGCTSTAEEPPGLTASPTVSATPTPEPTEDTAAVEAAVLDAYFRYWDAVVAAERGNPDPALFAGIATGVIVERALARARQFQEWEIPHEGEPAFTDVTVEVEGATATVMACVDHTNWTVEGVDMTATDLVVPGGNVLELVDGAWIVTDEADATAVLTC